MEIEERWKTLLSRIPNLESQPKLLQISSQTHLRVISSVDYPHLRQSQPKKIFFRPLPPHSKDPPSPTHPPTPPLHAITEAGKGAPHSCTPTPQSNHHPPASPLHAPTAASPVDPKPSPASSVPAPTIAVTGSQEPPSSSPTNPQPTSTPSAPRTSPIFAPPTSAAKPSSKSWPLHSG